MVRQTQQMPMTRQLYIMDASFENVLRMVFFPIFCAEPSALIYSLRFCAIKIVRCNSF